MPRIICALVIFLTLSAVPSWAEKNLRREPGTTRYAAMVSQLKDLLAYDQHEGAGRMALSSIGASVKGRGIWMVTLRAPVAPTAPELGDGGSDPHSPGDGGAAPETTDVAPPKKLFYLCRQHGHEPASTEGALAFICRLVKANPDSMLAQCLKTVTVYIVPMANPDGSEAFLRHNAHDADINRDWIKQTQPETRAIIAAINMIKPDLMTDQHELYPDDTRPDFTETAGGGSGARPDLVATCDSTQDAVQGVLLAEGFPTVSHRIDDQHPARLAHRYGCVVLGVPTILFETNRLHGSGRTVAQRATAHEQFMTDLLRDLAGQRPQLLMEYADWQTAHARNLELLASRKKPYHRGKQGVSPPAGDKGDVGSDSPEGEGR